MITGDAHRSFVAASLRVQKYDRCNAAFAIILRQVIKTRTRLASSREAMVLGCLLAARGELQAELVDDAAMYGADALCLAQSLLDIGLGVAFSLGSPPSAGSLDVEAVVAALVRNGHDRGLLRFCWMTARCSGLPVQPFAFPATECAPWLLSGVLARSAGQPGGELCAAILPAVARQKPGQAARFPARLLHLEHRTAHWLGMQWQLEPIAGLLLATASQLRLCHHEWLLSSLLLAPDFAGELRPSELAPLIATCMGYPCSKHSGKRAFAGMK